MVLALSLNAQQMLVQNADIKYKVSNIEYRVYENAGLQINPIVNLNQRKGSINLELVDAMGNVNGTFEVMRFDDCGGAGYIANETEWLDFQEVESAASQELANIAEDIVCLSKKRTVAEVENDASELSSIDEQLSLLSERETEIRDNEIFLPENRVNAKWVYTYTFDKLINEYMDGWELSEAGLQAVRDRVVYYGDEIKEITIRLGKVEDFFGEPPSVVVEGTFTKDSEDCYVLGANQSISLAANLTYRVGRMGLCDGRTNINGDTFTISNGEVISFSGVVENEGVYTIISEDFEIVIDGSFSMTKGPDGQFMVFAIKGQ